MGVFRKKNKENSTSLEDLLAMFEDNISIADINASRYLGKISASIVKRRMELKMSQKEFAGYLGVSQGMVSRWEGGDYNFSIKALSEIAEKLDITEDRIIDIKSFKDSNNAAAGFSFNAGKKYKYYYDSKKMEEI